MRDRARLWIGVAAAAITLAMTADAPGRPAGPREGARPGAEVNACGCYRDANDRCVCRRQNSCGCPGRCEPVGCEAERQKDLARRMELEIQRVLAEEKARGAAEAPAETDEEAAPPSGQSARPATAPREAGPRRSSPAAATAAPRPRADRRDVPPSRQRAEIEAKR